jgi:uncharacterized phage-associated protein
MVMGDITVFDVADYFLSRVELEDGSLMTHLKLQKLCYYAQGWHWAFDDVPLFEQEFEAWAHGPVCPDLWREYKLYGYNPIPAPEEFDGSVFNESELQTLDAVWDAYGQFDAKYLERLTHQEKPWIEARKGCKPGELCDNVINQDTMKEYYKELLENG